MNVVNIAVYKFVPLKDLKELRRRLRKRCVRWDLKGTILLSTEGINVFVSGSRESIDKLLAEIQNLPGLADLEVKESLSDRQPFNRMLVRIKREIIAFGVEGIDPATRPAPKLAPRDLKKWLDEGRTVTLLDTRNDYEVKLGTFKNAEPIGVDSFRDLPEAVERLPNEMKEQPVVMFCTGGIRCEKAGPFMQQAGFKNVVQLQGGILKYFEECGGEHYEGECFVFDQRVALDPQLQETETTQCYACQQPLTAEDQRSPKYIPGESCPFCLQEPDERLAVTIEQRHEVIRRATNPLPGSRAYENRRPIKVPQKCDGLSILGFLTTCLPHTQSEQWREILDRGQMVNSAGAVTADHVVRAGERYQHILPGTIEPDVNPDIRILFEDQAIIVVNKPAPLPMHPSGRFNRNTLTHIMSEAYHPQVPRIAHRLDANTTGIVVLSRTRHVAGIVQPQFERREVEKVYLARIQGHPQHDAFVCAAPISEFTGQMGVRIVDENGLESRTEFNVLRRDDEGTALVEVRPITGRTNQIRVHLWHLGMPICGDPLYLPEQQVGPVQTLRVDDPPLCLHAWRIRFTHPMTGNAMTFEAPQPGWEGADGQ
jgi:RluA family pseudouridine synthase